MGWQQQKAGLRGKSTALRMIAGLEEISAGTVTIGDRVINDVPPKDRDIAMVVPWAGRPSASRRPT